MSKKRIGYSNCNRSVTLEENIMEIIEGYLAKNPIVMGSKGSKYQRIKFKVENINCYYLCIAEKLDQIVMAADKFNFKIKIYGYWIDSNNKKIGINVDHAKGIFSQLDFAIDKRYLKITEDDEYWSDKDADY